MVGVAGLWVGASTNDESCVTSVSDDIIITKFAKAFSSIAVVSVTPRPLPRIEPFYMMSSRQAVRRIGSLWNRHSRQSKVLARSRSGVTKLAPALVVPTMSTLAAPTRCETVAEKMVVVEEESPRLSIRDPPRWQRIKKKAVKAFRMLVRVAKLLVALAPVAALYPMRLLLSSGSENEKEDAHTTALQEKKEVSNAMLGWYLRICLRSAEWSGAAVIKLLQWAGSRPDLFGTEFCAVFSQLQDNTTPHAWKHTERSLREAYGDDWRDRIQVKEIIGSGCIGQVYKGIVKDKDGKDQVVAIKVMHPGVRNDIDVDLDLMRLAAHYLPMWSKSLTWLNMQGAVEEFASMLTVQLDLRKEAENMAKFNENFAGVQQVRFPQLVEGYEPSQDVLVETFMDGIPVLDYALQHRFDQRALSELCLVGIKAVCKMIFLDNFLHGDLHPGNIFVSPKDKTLIVLDCGIVTEYTDRDHQLIVDILASFIHKNGRRAGRLMIDDSNTRLDGTDVARNENQYIDKINDLTIRASGPDYFMEHLGTYISYICDAAAEHHVMMNQSFVSTSLAVKVQEGIALALDPSVEIWRVANPIILKGETRRRLKRVGRKIENTLVGDNRVLSKALGLETYLYS